MVAANEMPATGEAAVDAAADALTTGAKIVVPAMIGSPIRMNRVPATASASKRFRQS